MRPQSIVRFEQAYLASIVIWLVNLALGWSARVAAIEDNPAFRGNPQMLELAQLMMLGAAAVMLLIWLALWYFTARRASVVTKWLLVGLLALSAAGMPMVLASIGTLGLLSGGLSVLAFALNAYAVWQLFRPDAKPWFAGDTMAADRPEPTDQPL
jgi:hypothetical protein